LIWAAGFTTSAPGGGIRARILADPERQRCALCGRSIWHCRDHSGKVLAPHVDHIKPIADAGHPFDEANLQAVCSSCHSLKTNSEQHDHPIKVKSADPTGLPLDPRHAWNQERAAGGRRHHQRRDP
jgi:5-methylcytosine-specific restriction endonuclease McrA